MNRPQSYCGTLNKSWCKSAQEASSGSTGALENGVEVIFGPGSRMKEGDKKINLR